jgi:hypothetical protein
MKFKVNQVFVDKIEYLSLEYAHKKAEGKSGKYFIQSFNAAKRSFIEIAYYLYIECFSCGNAEAKFNGNNINSKLFRCIDKNNYKSILDILEYNNVISVNNIYCAKRFSKSFCIHRDMISLIHNSKCKLNYSDSIFVLEDYPHLYKMLSSLPSIYVAKPKTDDWKFNKQKRDYKRERETIDVENTQYQKLTYDEAALEKYCDGDELKEFWYTNKLKGLKKNPDVIWNRYYHLFHHLPKDFRTQVLRLNGQPIVEAFDVPGSDIHMLAKLLEQYDIPAKQLEKFQRDVKSDFRKLFGSCKSTGKAKSYVKTAFKKYLNSTKDFYSNIRYRICLLEY